MFDILGKGRSHRLVSAAIFVYDCSRFLFLLAALEIFLKPGPDFRAVTFPLLMYVSPNALFPIMAFFLFIRFDSFRAYIPLYVTGKVFSLLCVSMWLLFPLRSIFNVTYIFNVTAPGIVWVVSLGAADLGTIVGMASAPPMEPPKEIPEGGE